MLLALLVAPWIATPVDAQAVLAPEPTYRYAGRYEGEWVADRLDIEARAEGPRPTSIASQPGRLSGTLALELDCAGTITGRARGQTTAKPSFQLVAASDDEERTVQASLDLVGEVELGGALSGRALQIRTGRTDGALEGTLVTRPREPDAVVLPAPLQAWYAADRAGAWPILSGAPGLLSGTWDGAADLPFAPVPELAALQVRSAGHWSVRRVAVEFCPWQGEATVRGRLPPARHQEEFVEFTFRPLGDGRLAGEGRGRATLDGGATGGCQYSGGGPFAVRVSGEEREGRFRLRFEDDDQPQLLLASDCPSGRSVVPHYILLSALLNIELPPVAGADMTAEFSAPDGRHASLELRIRPAAGAAPP